MDRIDEYVTYHCNSSRALDIDPQVEAIAYLCERFELNEEQRYWLCFLFATNYCVPTTYFMYNEFPDYGTVDTGRMSRWWERNKAKLIFQTDRRWIKMKDCMVAVYESYRAFVERFSPAGRQSEAIAAVISGAGSRRSGMNGCAEGSM